MRPVSDLEVWLINFVGILEDIKKHNAKDLDLLKDLFVSPLSACLSVV